MTHQLDELNINIEKLSIFENNPTFYDDIKSFLKTVKAAKNNINKIDWKKIEYPPNLYNVYDNKRNNKTEISFKMFIIIV